MLPDCSSLSAAPACARPRASPPSRVFSRHVVPLFSRLGCNAGACHGAVKGQNGFRLSLFGADPAARSRPAAARGRRPAARTCIDPDASLLLLKATGQVAHEGGKRMAVGQRRVPASCATGSPPAPGSTRSTQSRVTRLTRRRRPSRRVKPGERYRAPGDGRLRRRQHRGRDGALLLRVGRTRSWPASMRPGRCRRSASATRPSSSATAPSRSSPCSSCRATATEPFPDGRRRTTSSTGTSSPSCAG